MLLSLKYRAKITINSNSFEERTSLLFFESSLATTPLVSTIFFHSLFLSLHSKRRIRVVVETIEYTWGTYEYVERK